MIGSQELAEALTNLLDSQDDPALAGFYYLAEGISRVAYLGPDDFVYKVEIDGFGTNEDEYHWFEELMQIGVPEGWDFAKCDLIDHVLVMEYIPGDEPYAHYAEEECNCSGRCIIDEYGDLRDHTGLWDMHSGNFRIRDGVKVLIDYAA